LSKFLPKFLSNFCLNFCRNFCLNFCQIFCLNLCLNCCLNFCLLFCLIYFLLKIEKFEYLFRKNRNNRKTEFFYIVLRKYFEVHSENFLIDILTKIDYFLKWNTVRLTCRVRIFKNTTQAGCQKTLYRKPSIYKHSILQINWTVLGFCFFIFWRVLQSFFSLFVVDIFSSWWAYFLEQ